MSAGKGYIKLTVSYDHCVSSKTAVYKKSLKEFKQMTDAEALTWQWTVWGISEIEPLQMQILVQKFFVAEEKRNEKLIASSEQQLARPLAVLDRALDGRDWLVANQFSTADLNLAGVMLLLGVISFDYAQYTNVKRWADACYVRPALARVLAL